MSAQLKKIVVFTATGDQGSSVCRYLIKDGSYEVVGITRNPESDSSKALAKIGVKLVKAELSDPSTYKPALEGLYGAFVNADFWQRYFSNGMDGDEAGEFEAGQSQSAITACAEAGAKHIVYSTLDGPGYVPHMDKKQATSRWAKAQGYPVTDLYTGHYISNITKFNVLKKQDDGSFLLEIPAPDECVLINYAVEQTGGWVVAAFKSPTKYIGSEIRACSEKPTVKEWAQTISDITGKKVVTSGVTQKDFLENADKYQPFELYLNYKSFLDESVNHRDPVKSKVIYPDQWDTKAWAANSEAFKALVA